MNLYLKIKLAFALSKFILVKEIACLPLMFALKMKEGFILKF